MDEAARDQVESMTQQIQDLQAALTKEKVSNLELDQTQKELQLQITELTDSLAAEKAENQRLTDHVQVLDLHLEDKDLLIAEQQQRIQVLQAQLMQLEDSEFGGKYDIKFEDENASGADSDHSDSKELRHRLLEEQMKHEQLQRAHRASIHKLEKLELDHLRKMDATAGAIIYEDKDTDDTARLQRKVDALEAQLLEEKKKRESLDRERRSSLAALSQNMFKKLLDSEHQHYDDKSDLERQCQQLKKIVHHLEKSKHSLLQETNHTIDELRDHIKLLARRLQKYENWQ